MIKRRTIFSLTGALAFGLVIALVVWPGYERAGAFRGLFSANEARRSEAMGYFSAGVGEVPEITRIQDDFALPRRVIELLQQHLEGPTQSVDDDVFGDVAAFLDRSGFWNLDWVPTELFLQRIELSIRSGEEQVLWAALKDLTEIRERYTAMGEERDAVAGLYRALMAKAEVGSDLRMDTLAAAVRWLGIEGMGRSGVVEIALRDGADAELRRRAWLMVGLMDPLVGFSADWESEADERVVEAILWATMVTNRDHVEPLLQAIGVTPWRTTILPWLLAQSKNGDALNALRGLQLDGNPTATIPLLERTGEEGEVRVSDFVRAFLGLGEAEEFRDDAILYRWYLWRRAAAHSYSLSEFRPVVSNPVAADGSVWAGVLLAERLLNAEDAGRLALNYLGSFLADEVRAGILLAGLLGQHAEMVEKIRSTSTDVGVRRVARLALLLYADDVRLHPLEMDFGERLLNSDEKLDDGLMVDILALMLAIKHEAGLRRLFEVEETPGEQLLQYGWLIERFLPDGYRRIAPLHPWRNSVAALQLDILRISAAISVTTDGADQ